MYYFLEGPNGFSGSEVVSSLSGYPHQKKIEAAGRHYSAFIRKYLGIEEDFEDEKAKESIKKDEEKEEAENISAEDKKKYEQKRHKKLLQSDDYYDILGLGHLRWKATDEDIRKAYKSMVLKYHPDKNSGISDEMFKKISSAYEILSDPRGRKIYDSEDDFDDIVIPNLTSCDPKEFFNIFIPLFQKFAKWSVHQNIPSLGDETSPYESVRKFYDFWYSFRSWRDFSFSDEFDPREAETREEKRWMERQNEKERKKKKREETAKIRRLTELAEKFDPRIHKYKEEQKELKKKLKLAKMEEQRKRHEELEKEAAKEREKKEQEEKRKAEEAAAIKQKKAEEAKHLNSIRNKIRQICLNFPAEDVETICLKLPVQELTSFLTNLQNSPPEKLKEVFNHQVKKMKEEEKAAEEAKSQLKKDENKSKPWTQKELSLLAQGVVKYPGGVRNRWQLIADFVGTRTMKEVIAKANETKTVPNNIETLCKVADGTQEALTTATKRKGSVPVDTNPSIPEPKQEGDPASWTSTEQKLLEKALATYPSSDKERWDKIAAAVPGRTKKECIVRYKFLVEQLKASKK